MTCPIVGDDRPPVIASNGMGRLPTRRGIALLGGSVAALVFVPLVFHVSVPNPWGELGTARPR